MAYEVIGGPSTATSKATEFASKSAPSLFGINPVQVARVGGGALVRGAENVAGAGGDILSLLLRYTSEPFGGKSYKEIQDESGYLSLPTSAQVKENVTTPLTGTFFEPQGAGEEWLQDLGGTFISLVSPFLGGVKPKTAVKMLAGGELGGLIGQGIGGEYGKPIGKFLGMVAGSTAGTKSQLRSIMDQGYKVEKELAKDLVGNPTTLARNAESIIADINKADIPETAKNFARERVNSALNKIQAKEAQTINTGLLNAKGSPITRTIASEAPKLKVTDALDSLRDVNRYLKEVPKEAKEATPYLKQTNQILNDYIKGTANKAGAKDFVKSFETSQELYKGLNGLDKLGKTINEYVNWDSIKSPIVKDLLKGLSYGIGRLAAVPGSKTISKTGAGLAGIAGTALGLKSAYRMQQLWKNSPIARQTYKNILSHAAQGAYKPMLAEIGRLDKIANQWEKNHPSQYEVIA